MYIASYKGRWRGRILRTCLQGLLGIAIVGTWGALECGAISWQLTAALDVALLAGLAAGMARKNGASKR